MTVTEQNEQKKEYLNSYIKHKKKILRIQAELEEIEELQCSAGSMKTDGMPHSKGVTKDLSDYTVKIEEEKERIIKERYLQIKDFSNIRERISSMKNEESKSVLIYRYIKGYTWEEISKVMFCSVRQVYRKHGIALKEFNLPKKEEKEKMS